MVKLAEIAQASGFSIPVVSRVLNPGRNCTAKVAETTRAKILETANALGYKPNRNAEFLKRGRIPTIGVFLPHYRNSLITDLVMGISSSAAEAGFPVSFDFDTKYANYRKFLEETRGQCNCGIITYPDFKLDAEAEKLITTYLDEGGKIVLINAGDFMPTVPHIEIDNREGGHIAANALLEAGCDEMILFTSSTLCRSEGFREVLEGQNYSVREYVEWHDDFQAVVDFCVKNRKRKIGIFATADRSAIKIHTMLMHAGIIPGTNVKLIGYDNLFLTERMFPSLASISQPFVQVGKYAVEALVASIYGKPAPDVHLYPELIHRQTLDGIIG